MRARTDGSDGSTPAGAPERAREARAAAVPDHSREPVELPRDLATELFSHARECYPEECCGILTGPPDAPPERLVRCTNVQSQRLAQGESDLDATQAFWIDELELLQALREAESRGHTLRAVYHSHIDKAAYLSHTDLRGAIGPEGTPLWPGASQLVVSVSAGQVSEAAIYQWDAAERRFEGRLVKGAA